DVLEPAVSQEIAAAFGHEFDILKGVALLAEPLFAHDERRVTLQAGDLPVDVEHLRLEVSGAVAGNDRARNHVFFLNKSYEGANRIGRTAGFVWTKVVKFLSDCGGMLRGRFGFAFAFAFSFHFGNLRLLGK